MGFSEMVAFSGTKYELISFLNEINGSYYVYELCRPGGQVFYVGKGTKRRAMEHELEALRAHPFGESNPFKCNVIRKILREGGEIGYRIDSVFAEDDEAACLAREAELIACYGCLHEGGGLTNLASGKGNATGPAPYSKDKHAATLWGEPTDNPDRATLNRFLQSIGPVKSVPVKPISQMSRILPTTPHPKESSASDRRAYAIVASAIAHGLYLRPGVEVPRRFSFEGVEGIIENGVARRLVKAGMVTLIAADDPRDERFQLDAEQFEGLVKLLGREMLAARGLI